MRYGVTKNFAARRAAIFFFNLRLGQGGKEGRSVPSVLARGPEKNEHWFHRPTRIISRVVDLEESRTAHRHGGGPATHPFLFPLMRWNAKG